MYGLIVKQLSGYPLLTRCDPPVGIVWIMVRTYIECCLLNASITGADGREGLHSAPSPPQGSQQWAQRWQWAGIL